MPALPRNCVERDAPSQETDRINGAVEPSRVREASGSSSAIDAAIAQSWLTLLSASIMLASKFRAAPIDGRRAENRSNRR